MKRSLLAVSALALLLLCSNRANAQVTVSGNVATHNAPAQITLASDLTFTITTAGNVDTLTFDNWVTTFDGSQTSDTFAPGSVLTYVLDGTTYTTTFTYLIDNLGATFRADTPTDGYALLGATIPVNVGDTLTIKAGTWGLVGTAGFNTQVVANSPFTGDTFLTTSGVVLLSNHVAAVPSAVPEPSTYALIAGVCLLGWAVLRRRQQVAA